MTKAYSRFVTSLFCLFFGGLLAGHLILPDAERSETENRLLAQLPKFSWIALADGSYAEKIETYFADQFPGRDTWTGAKARAEQIIGKQEFHETYLCGDRLIAAVKPPDSELVAQNLISVSQKRIPVIIGLIPSAAEIWKEQLPEGAPNWDQLALLDRIKLSGYNQIDFHTVLQKHKEEPIFYRTDHHWTTLGAYYGYTAVMEALGKTPLPREQFDPEIASDQFQGTLYAKSGVHWLKPDTIEFWVSEAGLQVTSWRTGTPQPSALYDRTYLQKKDKYSAFLGGNQPLCVIENANAPEEEKILLVRDSYSDALAPFLTQHYKQVHLIDLRYYRGSVEEYAQTQGIDHILILYSIPNFITDHNLILLRK